MNIIKFSLIAAISSMLLLMCNANATTQEDRAIATIEILKERKDAEDRANINAMKREISGGVSSSSISNSFTQYAVLFVLFMICVAAKEFYKNWKDTAKISDIREQYEKLKFIYAESSSDSQKVADYKKQELEIIRKKYEGPLNGEKHNFSKERMPGVLQAHKSLLQTFIDDDKIERHASLRAQLNALDNDYKISWDDRKSQKEKLINSYE